MARPAGDSPRMIANGYLHTLVAYSVWANDRVRRAAVAWGFDLYAREVGGSFPLLRATLVHMYGAERLWFQRLSAGPGTADAAGPLWTPGFAVTRLATFLLLERRLLPAAAPLGARDR